MDYHAVLPITSLSRMMFMHKILAWKKSTLGKYENINNSDLDGMSLASFCQSRAVSSQKKFQDLPQEVEESVERREFLLLRPLSKLVFDALPAGMDGDHQDDADDDSDACCAEVVEQRPRPQLAAWLGVESRQTFGQENETEANEDWKQM